MKTKPNYEKTIEVLNQELKKVTVKDDYTIKRGEFWDLVIIFHNGLSTLDLRIIERITEDHCIFIEPNRWDIKVNANIRNENYWE